MRVNLDEVKLREFGYPEDYPAVYALWATAGPGIHLRLSDEAQEIEKKCQRDPDLFILAEVEGQIVGTVLGGYDGRRGMMYHLAVAVPYRRQGIATRLVDEIERRLKAKGCVRYYLLMDADNQAALSFYQRRGWEVMDLLALAKTL
jgi:ribosomal protein S18 acetylase RimI-like enzyme